MSYRIGSFNMYKFNFRSDGDIRKDIQKIAEIIVTERLDIVALQEVLSSQAIKLLKRYLGDEWSYRWEQPRIGAGYSGSSQEAEGYAFLWNKKTMELSWTNRSDGNGESLGNNRWVAEPHIYNQYRIDRKAGEEELARNPYYGRFKPIHGFCELRLLNTHFYFGDNYKENIDKRKNEFNILVRNLYHQISDRRYGNNLPAYTIILGDYNLNLKRDWTKAPYLEECVIVNDAGVEKHIRTFQDQLTTLKRSNDSGINESEEGNVRGYSNNYDHFTYDTDRFEGVKAKSQRIDTVRKYTNDDFSKHRKEISDHVPIVLTMDLR